jgi:hypothetical protein
MELESPEVEDLLAGDALGCVHAADLGGCGGASDCEQCVLRKSLESTFASGQGVQYSGRMTLSRGGTIVSEAFVMATAMLSLGDRQAVLTNSSARCPTRIGVGLDHYDQSTIRVRHMAWSVPGPACPVFDRSAFKSVAKSRVE